MKQLKTLLKELDFTQGAEYFDYCMDSYHNGQIEQAKNLFNAMTNKDRSLLLIYISGCYDQPTAKGVFRFFATLLNQKF